MDGNAYKYEAIVKEAERCGAAMRQPDGTSIPCPKPKAKGGLRCRIHGGVMTVSQSNDMLADAAISMRQIAKNRVAWPLLREVVKMRKELAAMEDFTQKRDVLLLVDMCVYEMLEIMDK